MPSAPGPSPTASTSAPAPGGPRPPSRRFCPPIRAPRPCASPRLDRPLRPPPLGRITPMAAFDWAWPTRIDRAAVEAALRLDFLAAGRNCVLVAAQGLGKTMIAQNIAHQAVLAGHHVLFTTAAQLLLDLGSQESARGLARRLTYYGQRGGPVFGGTGPPPPAPPP